MISCQFLLDDKLNEVTTYNDTGLHNGRSTVVHTAGWREHCLEDTVTFFA